MTERRRRRPRRRVGSDVEVDRIEIEVSIGAIGGEGDGLAYLDDGRTVAVSGTLPGERHRVRIPVRGAVKSSVASLERLQSVQRRTPVCRHFEPAVGSLGCGGCVAQHLPDALYRDWKVGRVERALRQAGLQADVLIAHLAALGERRRIRLAIHRARNGVEVGYRARASRTVIPIAECPIAADPLLAVLPALRTLLASLDGLPGEAVLTRLDTGVDVVLGGLSDLTLADRERLAAFAEASDLVRISRRLDVETGDIEPLAARRPATLAWPGLTVEVPPDAFLQASAEAEAVLQASVKHALPASGTVLDLYAGIGTLSAPVLDAGMALRAVEGSEAAVEAFARAVPGGDIVVRDLHRRPLQTGELKGVALAILDPPRAGALAQVQTLAESAVPAVLSVSCNPATFARDARVLVDHGFALGPVALVDQFLFSAEIEVVAHLTRA